MTEKAPHSKPHFLGGDINIPKVEEKVLAYWDEHKIFDKSLAQTADGKPFTFYDGPPFATGLPHYGHILASTVKDLVPRYQTMNGRFVRRRWGWDCHGLPIEEVVERKLGISGKKQIEEIGIKTFNETCRSMVLTFAHEWRALVRRIARWVDFDNSYKTLDADFMESVWWGFKQIYDKGLVYEGRKVLMYCPRCETPLSNFEVAMDNSYKDVQEETVYVKFHLKPGQKFGKYTAGEFNDYLIAWTTTPWTLPGNVALAVGPEISYTAVRVKDDPKALYVVAHDLIEKVFKKQEVEIAHTGIKAAEMVGLEYEPLFEVAGTENDASHKVYAANFVNTADGTGIVHIAPVNGEDDYQLGLKNGLPILPLLDEKGEFIDGAPELVRGMYFKDSERFIKNDLESRGLLYRREQHVHSYPFCWRCGTMLYYNAIPAWFINIQKIKAGMLDTNDREMQWYPDHLKHGRYEKSIESAPDWNISRNRYWGNPVPVWKCEKCNRVEVVGSLEELSEKAGGARNDYWVMRHGEAESNMFDILDSGQRKYLHLTPRGKEQALAAAEKFKKELAHEYKKIDLVIASDITRTADTEHIVANALGLGKKETTDTRIEEIHLGPTLTGYKDEKYAERFPTYASRFESTPEGGESLRDLRARMWNFLKECEEKYEGKNILIVTHEYPAWMLTQAAEGWSEARATAEKGKRGPDFIGFAEIRKLNVLNISRNDTGEADLHRPYIDSVVLPCGSCGGTMVRTPEIFDSWIEAGSMPFAEYHYPFENKEVFHKRFPAQFVVEYIAQTRAWFQLTHVISYILFGHAPFENVVTTGTILAEDGQKMSKSKGNFPDPNLLINKYGADALRFYLMSSVVMQADNFNFSEKGVQDVYRKVNLLLTNVYKYFATYEEGGADRSNKGDDNDAGAEDSGEGNLLDRWIRTRTGELVETVTAAFDAYDTVRATRAIQEYVGDLSTWYLRRSRKRKDAGFFETMRGTLLVVAKTIAPVMPFLAEALYLELADANMPESVHLTGWPKVEYSLSEKERTALIAGMAEVRRLASIGLARRAEAKIKVRQPLAKLIVRDKNPALGDDEGLLAILKSEVNVKEVVFDPKLDGGREAELDTAITPALREEGLLREAVRMIQELRQKAGLQPKDRIIAMIDLPGEAKNAVLTHEAEFQDAIGADEVNYARSDKFTAEEETKFEGENAWAGIRKI